MSHRRLIRTIGHSTHPLADFLRLLHSAGIRRIADVRRFPGSRRLPHFNREAFEASLLEAGVSYRHYPEMGGRRAPRAGGSVNTGWRVAAFNAFADHMATADFAKALADLEEFASEGDAAVMCSEGLPWKCHRRLIADGLITRGWEVVDVMPDGKERPAALTTFAAVSDGILVYKQT